MDGASFLKRFDNSLALHSPVLSSDDPQWGAAEAEIKVPSDENTELKRSSFKVWSRSVYGHIYHCHLLPEMFSLWPYIPLPLTARKFFLAKFYPSGPFICIFQKLSLVFPVLAVANTGSFVHPQNEIGHPA